MKATLLAIALFVLLGLGSFIWLVATWDATVEEPVSALPSQQEDIA